MLRQGMAANTPGREMIWFREIVTLYGAGGVEAQKWFYLVLRTGGDAGLPSEKIARLGNHDINSFVASGANLPDYAFVLVDIGGDARLETDLNKLAGGPELMARIKDKVPLFLITPSPIPQIDDIKDIAYHPIKDYEKDSDVIYAAMGLHRPKKRRAFVRFLKRTNQYLHLKPNILGIGVNLNEMIEHWLEHVDKRI
jgi:hypothetical protein